MSLVILAVDSNALPLVKEDPRPRCIKIDECSCRLKNVPEPGLINLHGLVSDKHEPRFITEGESEQTGGVHTFYYNPCMTFSDLGCPNTSVCQENTYDNKYFYYDLGNIDTTEFEYQNNTVVAIYKSQAKSIDDINRTSEVELVCDETEVLGRFEFVGEPIPTHYIFKLYTQCACPGGCKRSKIECVGQDLCTCEMSDGTGTINLHSLDNPLNPMKDESNPAQTIFYNPCSSVATPDCGNHSVCEIQGGSIMGLGYASTAKFVYNRRLGIEYLGNEGSLSSTVNLICDYSQRDEPRFRVDKTTNTYSVRSVCACPDGCDAPDSPIRTLSCIQIDSCTCKSNSDNAIINLHDLNNPYAPLTTTDSTDYTYYYNPCSGLKIKVDDKGKCDGEAGCQFDPYVKNYNNMGQIYPKIDYNAATKEFTFHYTNGEYNRSFDVRMICDPKADSPVLATDGDIHHGLFYPLTLTTKLACF